MIRNACLAYLLFVGASQAAAQSFSGPHAEAVIGYNNDGDRDDGGFAVKGGSLIYGGSVGYDLRMGNAVIGIMGEISDTNARDCISFDGPPQPGTPAIRYRECTAGGRSNVLGARIGYVVSENTLLYALGGYANNRTKQKLFQTGDQALSPRKLRVDREGFRLGAGVERAINRHAFVRAEYRYTDDGAAQNQVVTAFGWRF